WYPSMRLFRQPANGDWDSVFRSLVSSLEGRVASAAVSHPLPQAPSREEEEQVARALLENNRLDLALPRLRRMAEEGRESANLRNCLGVAYARQGQTAAAAGEFRTAVRLDPAFIGAWSNLATALAQSGDEPGAEAALREILRQRPEHAEAACRLADLLR